MIQFIKDMLSSASPTSSKRVFGGIAFIAATTKIVGWQPDLTETLLFTAATLIGLDALTKMFKK